MPLTLKPIGRDDFESILAEVKARVPVHTPEWTQIDSESDPGTTLLELFAFMSESLLYRANNIPERNRVKFLQLLRLGLRPAHPARGFVVFEEALSTQPYEAGLDLLAGKVPFRTTTPVTILPIEGQVMYKKPVSLNPDALSDYSAAYEGFRATDASELRFYETTPFPQPRPGAPLPRFDVDTDAKIDRSIWIALLAPKKGMTLDAARAAIGGRTLCVGIMPALRGGAVISPYASAHRTDAATSAITWEISTTERIDSGAAAAKSPKYEPLLDVSYDTDVLQEPGIVSITLPPASRLGTWTFDEPAEEGAGNYPPRIEEEDVRDRVIAWVRMRLRGNGTDADLSWIGINAATVVQASAVPNELLGKGTGEPDQVLSTSRTPVLEETLVLDVEEEAGAWTTWKRVDDFLAHPVEDTSRRDRDRVYVLDRESGEIRFGNGIFGRRPPLGARVRATYQSGGGIEGNVPIDAINKAPVLSSGKVRNPLPTRGGAAKESVTDAERRIPGYLRHHNRAVTEDDFREVANQTPGVDIGRIEVLPVYHPTLGDDTPGCVTLMVIPSFDLVSPDAPQPDTEFLRAICTYIEPRRLITTEVHVVGPCYVPVWVSVGVKISRGYGRDAVLQRVRQALEHYLSPLVGGPDPKGTGWPLGKKVLARDLEAIVTRVEGVEYVESDLLLASETSRDADSVAMRGLELPHLVGVSVVEGDPVPMDEVVGDAPVAAPDVVPVPVVPEVC